MKHLKTHLLIMMLYLSLSLLLETTTASAEDKQAETAVNQTLMADVVSLESAGYSEFSSRLKDSRVPPSASDIWVSSIGVIDGHEQFIRYVSPQKDFIEACGAFCTDRNAVHKLPPVWPTSEDLEIPRWFTMVPECDQMRAWLTLDTHPYITEMYGEKVHCGYTQVAGILIGRNAATHTTYIFDFSIQWYRTGCGG